MSVVPSSADRVNAAPVWPAQCGPPGPGGHESLSPTHIGPLSPIDSFSPSPLGWHIGPSTPNMSRCARIRDTAHRDRTVLAPFSPGLPGGEGLGMRGLSRRRPVFGPFVGGRQVVGRRTRCVPVCQRLIAPFCRNLLRITSPLISPP